MMSICFYFYNLLIIAQDSYGINHLNILLFFKELLFGYLYLESFYPRRQELKFG